MVPPPPLTALGAPDQRADACEIRPLSRKKQVRSFSGWHRNLPAAANLSPLHLSLTLNIQVELQAMYSRIKLSNNKDSQSDRLSIQILSAELILRIFLISKGNQDSLFFFLLNNSTSHLVRETAE